MINKFIDHAWGRISWEPSDPIVYGWGPTTMIQHCSHAAIFYCSNGPNLAVATIVMRRSSDEQFWRQRPVKLVAMGGFDVLLLVHLDIVPPPPSRSTPPRAVAIEVHAVRSLLLRVRLHCRRGPPPPPSRSSPTLSLLHANLKMLMTKSL
jgi:hypothetical protein